jgi:hypothetical protein
MAGRCGEAEGRKMPLTDGWVAGNLFAFDNHRVGIKPVYI